VIGKVETMFERGWSRVALAALLIVHGAIHVIAPLVLWDLAEFRDIDGEPTVAMSATSADAFGVVWFVVLAAFVAAGVAVLARRGWWVPVSLVSVVVSQILIVLWWDGAWRGTIANALIVAAVWIAICERRADRPEA
jgi:hypothetical protein